MAAYGTSRRARISAVLFHQSRTTYPAWLSVRAPLHSKRLVPPRISPLSLPWLHACIEDTTPRLRIAAWLHARLRGAGSSHIHPQLLRIRRELLPANTATGIVVTSSFGPPPSLPLLRKRTRSSSTLRHTI